MTPVAVTSFQEEFTTVLPSSNGPAAPGEIDNCRPIPLVSILPHQRLHCLLRVVSCRTGSVNSSGVRPQAVEMEFYEGPDVTSKTGYGNCQWLYPLDQP